MWWLLVIMLVACGNHDAPVVTTGSGSNTAKAKSGDAAIEAPPPVEMGSDGVPLVCGDWKAAIDKLQTCKALPEAARASLIAVYTEASTGWGQLPADAKQHLVSVCRAGADSVLKGAKATCGW
ncbi:MAG: hypothetical protein ABJE66_02240 [Deltaproteobacteria bacterium]